MGDQFPNPGLVVGDNPSLARRTDGDIHLGLCYINAYVCLFLFHLYLLCEALARPCTIRA